MSPAPLPGFAGLGSILDAELGRRLSADELRRELEGRGEHYRRLGVRPGQRVVLAHGRGWRFFADLFGLWRAGACVIPVDPDGGPAELSAVADDSQAAWLVHAGRAGAASAAAALESPDALAAARSPERPPQPHRTPDEDALILYTSGTTGRPKGIVHTFASVGARLGALRAFVPAGEVGRTPCVLPTQIGHGLIGNSLYPLLCGGELVLLPPFGRSPRLDLGRVIDEHRISFLSSVPALWRGVSRLSAPPALGTLRRIHCASAPLDGALWGDILEWSGIRNVLNVYGMTEAASWLSGAPAAPEGLRAGCVGKGWGAEFAVLDEKEPEAGRALPAGEIGEVWVKTDSLMRGYHGQEALTRGVLARGWLRTGDLGLREADGSLVLTGRKDDVINRAGLKIQPGEVEAALRSHPDVADACAFALPDPVAGQAVAAAVVLREGRPESALAAVARWCADRLPAPKRPSRWFRLDRLPRTAQGKLRRKEAAALCGAQPPP
ncbi:MAG: acyl--CoA ligase [Elusimicrobia bacterium]|nr:acyl--CoA ligase [Elusimicrobiota bacterium]